MIILYFFLLPFLYVPIKLILYIIALKFGKLSYDGFSAAGFSYNSEKDIFYSTKNAWQKNFGYSHMYDVGAPVFQMILDTEPIKFYYNNKNWLITFWKGQYGITTGAEIGVYCTNRQIVNKKTIYFPVKEDEMLDMGFVLYNKKGEQITKVRAKHWWLTSFKLGMFSKPKNLTMDIMITFPNQDMLNAFINAFKKKKYTSKHFKVINNTFYFRYKKTHTHKVWTRFFLSDVIRQRINRRNVKLYNKYLADVVDTNGKNDYKNKKQIYLNDLLPSFIKTNDDIDPNSIDISKKIDNQEEQINEEKEEQIILLNNSIYSTLKRNKI